MAHQHTSNKSRPCQYVRLSVLEQALLAGGDDVVLQFLDRWPVELVYGLQTLNHLLSEIIAYYISRRWNPKDLLCAWVEPVDDLMDVIQHTDSIVCGPAVCDFFRRLKPSCRNLDIITGFDGIDRIAAVLRLDSYSPGVESKVSTYQHIPFKTPDTVCYRLLVRTFVFQRVMHSWQKVSVHLIHGDPLEFLLASGSTNVMNVITGSYAISMFPRSTFVDYTFLENTGKTTRTFYPERMDPVLKDTECQEDLNYTKGGDAEELFGKREVGDSYCWTIRVPSALPVVRNDVLVSRGHKFRVRRGELITFNRRTFRRRMALVPPPDGD